MSNTKTLKVLSFINRMSSFILDYILPFKCLSCNELVVSANSFCPKCWVELNFITKPFCNKCGRSMPFTVEKDSSCLKCIKQSPSFDIARAVVTFDEKSKHLIHSLKYYDKTSIAKAFAKNLYSIYRKEIEEADLIIPVPMHKLKRMLRFYNQALVIAQAISELSHKPVCSNVLIKTKWTRSQASLSKKEREANLMKSFAIRNAEIIKNKKLVLVDDVSTTGSTAKACSEELKKYADKVVLLCIAFT